jgi:16S rRNA (guanine966-N2)-methyltransferase
MRIVAGAWKGRELQSPQGNTTRPTADRVRQALFDMLLHAPWGGRDAIEGARVLDAFAGTGALGLEALSRGAAFATFIERDPSALAALRANIARLRAEGRSAIVAGDPLAVGKQASSKPAGARSSSSGEVPSALVFLDPPYGADLVPRALAHLTAHGWIAPGALIVAETARTEPPLLAEVLAERTHGAARITIWRASASAHSS